MVGALLGGAAIGAGAELINGFFSRKAAKKAAEVQANANRAAGAHLEDTIRGVNPSITESAGRAGEAVRDASWNAITGVDAATVTANERLDDANSLLKPYANAGADATNLIRMGITEGGDFNRTPTLEEIQMDPGYAFRAAEGQKAIERSAAARGNVLGGGVLKDLEGYRQGVASQEYGNAFQRTRDTIKDRFDRLFKVSGAGQDAVTTQGKNLGTQGTNLLDSSKFNSDLSVGEAKYRGNLDVAAADRTSQNTIEGASQAGKYITGAGEATASGIVGGQNAITSAISGGVNNINSAITLAQLLKNPNVNNRFKRPNYIRDASGIYD